MIQLIIGILFGIVTWYFIKHGFIPWDTFDDVDEYV